MKHAQNFMFFLVLTMFLGLGFLFLSTDQANAGFACDIGIEKVADPADDIPFDFSAPGAMPPNFN